MPAQLGRYRLLELLGQGAMGAVYKAHDPELDRLVAVKLVRAALLADPGLQDEFRERFRREARAAARLSHPALVAVYDFGFDAQAGVSFLVMEYVPGVSLATVVREHGALPIAQALEVVSEVAAGLAEAHRQGIVHRDIKPGNILMGPDGRARLSDFGIARLPGSELTRAGSGLGTPGYLAPEALRGEPADERTDLFALGVVAYVLLTGQKPFDGPTPEAAGLQVLQHEPAAPNQLRPEVPAHVSTAVMRCLAKRPAERPASADEFLRALQGEAPTRTVGSTRPAALVEPTRTSAAVPPAARGRSRRHLLLLTLLALLSLAAGAGLWAWLGRAPATPGTPAERRPSAAPRPSAPPPERRAEPARNEDDAPATGPGKSHGRGKAKGHGKKKRD